MEKIELQKPVDWIWPVGLAAAYFCTSLFFISKNYDGSAVGRAIFAEFGGFSVFELMRPLYLPLLVSISKIASFLHIPSPHIFYFQLVSLFAASVALGLFYLLVNSRTNDRILATTGAVLLGTSGRFWFFAMQTKPYTLAVCILLIAIFLFMNENFADFSPRKRVLTGLVCASAASLDVPCVALVPVALFCLWSAKMETWRKLRFSLTLLATFAFAVIVMFLPIFFMRKEAILIYFSPTQFDQLLTDLAYNTMPGATIFSTGNLTIQLKNFFTNYLAVNPDAYICGILAVSAFFLSIRCKNFSKMRRELVIPVLLILSFAVFFIVVDTHNDFNFVVTCLLILVLTLAGSFSRMIKYALVVAALAVGLYNLKTRVLPDSVESNNPIWTEARFLSARLKAGDVLLCTGPPDTRLAYLVYRNFRIVRVDPYQIDYPVPAVESKPIINKDSLAVIAGYLNEGRKMLLAGDKLFRPANLIPEKEIEKQANDIYLLIKSQFKIRQPVISPSGQHYHPIGLQ